MAIAIHQSVANLLLMLLLNSNLTYSINSIQSALAMRFVDVLI